MADSSESRPVVKSTKPVSEALLNEKVSANPLSMPHIRGCTLFSVRPLPQLSDTSIASNVYSERRIADHIADDVTVGSRHFVHAHSVRARSVVRYCVLSSLVQAKSMACVGWFGLRSRTRLGRGRWSVEPVQLGTKPHYS